MTLEKLLLEKLASWRPHSARQTLTLEHADSGWIVDLVAECVESVGARLWEVRLSRLTSLPAPVALADQAAAIVARVTGLMEPLRLVEIDASRDLAQFRSTAPAARDGSLYYYEVVRNSDGTTHLSRYQAIPASGKRQQVAFSLTNEVLAKFVADLASI
jgi:hypothetical protein